jgi:feruloyl esterase
MEALRCRAGETGHPVHCLTAAQAERSLRIYHQGYSLPFAFANGARDYLGYNSLEGIAMQLGSQPALLSPPRSGPNAHHVDRAYQFFRYFVNQGRDFDIRQFDVTAPGPVRDRILEISGLFDATATDLSRFAARGGKIIWLHGHDDPSVSPLENRRNVQAVIARMGQEQADRFLRYFEIPGLAHGGASPHNGRAWPRSTPGWSTAPRRIAPLSPTARGAKRGGAPARFAASQHGRNSRAVAMGARLPALPVSPNSTVPMRRPSRCGVRPRYAHA